MFSQTGSTETAPTDQTLADWKRCEALLRTRKWIRANPVTCKGVEARLEMIHQAGLPPMKVISASKIEQLGRIPRSTEGHAIDAIDVRAADSRRPHRTPSYAKEPRRLARGMQTLES